MTCYPLRKSVAVTAFIAILCGCGSSTFEYTGNVHPVTPPQFTRALNTALSWPSPSSVDALLGARPIQDGSPVLYPEIAIARAAMRTNPRLTAGGALTLAAASVRAARANGLPPEFFAAMLLQESAFEPRAISSAGAVGIAQFTIDTAEDVGVDPFDPFDAIDGAARTVGAYYRFYRSRYGDPYGVALAAYNAGPGAVERYHGVPPYAETRDYISIIYQRWAHISSFEVPRKELRRARGNGTP